MEWTKQTYNSQYEKWVPWLEDQYLRWFTKDNKASYTAKENLDKSKVTGIEQVDTLQDGLNGLAAGQVGQGGLFQPVGDFASKEGANRSERQGRGENGAYGPNDGVPLVGAIDTAANNVNEGGKAVAGKAADGFTDASGAVGNLFGGGGGGEAEKKEKKEKK
ncbi:hypothetical protein G7046_g4980 [Stylonectria norvegica]|nr:hypothetical protein G7046_g4980 [Stylonectria norvegica]